MREKQLGVVDSTTSKPVLAPKSMTHIRQAAQTFGVRRCSRRLPSSSWKQWLPLWDKRSPHTHNILPGVQLWFACILNKPSLEDDKVVLSVELSEEEHFPWLHGCRVDHTVGPHISILELASLCHDTSLGLYSRCSSCKHYYICGPMSEIWLEFRNFVFLFLPANDIWQGEGKGTVLKLCLWSKLPYTYILQQILPHYLHFISKTKKSKSKSK